tara:strand:+ start:21 stop:920 length:900 start_codon:yes stop_codon:yes gene_type:complete
MSITFVGMRDRSSGIVRGLQLVDCDPNNNFLDKNTGYLYGKNKDISKNIIFVRSYDKRIASHFKSRGHTIGFDIIDRPVAELHKLQRSDNNLKSIDWSLFCHEEIDYYIVTNSLAKKELSKVTKKSIYVIPHHTVSKNIVKKNNNELKVLGYVGIEDQLNCRDEIIEYCNKRNLTFYENHPKDSAQCIEDLKKVDIGIIFLEKNNRTDYVLKYKPNQKLSNFQCFGIPTVCVKYESYQEFSSPGSCIFIDKKEDMFDAIDKIIADSNLRENIIKNGYISADKLLVKNVIKLYNKIKELE